MLSSLSCVGSGGCRDRAGHFKKKNVISDDTVVFDRSVMKAGQHGKR
ncbi:hypothetical protein GbCGDNIH2_7184 [Granulibacter bethesdensis]|uniref:Uncharacterized protein n=2 Tax=Granulibacter bethesdensis TaxID=364410 RepID=A0A286M321_GRABC|nr:hypothetical protein GbCGDNIH2_7184 [Granulibacter bethesdensis]ASV62420.1 hypothetical protein GbCGDNIH1_7184 [Granulibacter bethesdensis CGDNIH1]APG30459.1 hypothetical protein GbCGDNIH3_7184a [Granulibacter bethesdensis]APH52116.1 hypothetical protein GbCGDNIH5_7184 [Granulibacter bethesdensis]APH59734.1 hypothetical protein GbCGDNIH7_7184 [Granulibacter bethesdensis]